MVRFLLFEEEIWRIDRSEFVKGGTALAESRKVLRSSTKADHCIACSRRGLMAAFLFLADTRCAPTLAFASRIEDGRVPVDDQEVVPVSERLMGGL